MKNDQKKQVAIAILLIGLAIMRLAFHVPLSTRMDAIFFTVMGAGLLLLLIPLRYLKSFKAAGLEFSLDQPQVQAAIAGLSVDRIKNKKVQEHLSLLKDQLPAIRGSRVLWIDDYPHTVLGERRLLRALGVEVVTAISSEQAMDILERDNDFDLIISDVQRAGESYKETGGIRIHDGVNFAVWLRSRHPDPVISKLPIVFYAAYDWKRLIEFTRPARQYYPSPEIAKSEDDLIAKVVKLLAVSHSTPIHGSKEKIPTPVRGGTRKVAPVQEIAFEEEPFVDEEQESAAESSGGEEEHFG